MKLVAGLATEVLCFKVQLFWCKASKSECCSLNHLLRDTSGSTLGKDFVLVVLNTTCLSLFDASQLAERCDRGRKY